MEKWKTIWKVIWCGLCAAGCLWFLLPLLHGGFGLGAGFGFCVCGLCLGLTAYYHKLAARGGWRRLCARVLAGLYVLGLGWAGFLTGLMFSAQHRTPPENTHVVVLGAQVYSAERMGMSLRNRVNRAYAYLEENPQALCIVTGGQGGDEPCPESLTQKNALVRMGVAPERIYMEDKSHNTRENMAFAMDIAQGQGMGTEVAIVTQSFHMYRALRLAENAGFTAYSLVADTDPIIFPEYYGRELLSLTKWWVERLLVE